MIHYHGTPMTPATDMVKAFAARHAMVSFAHPEQIEVCAEICQSVALDNGAFSAWKQGTAYDFAGYAEWCQEWTKHPAIDWCIIPDVIDGDESRNDALIDAWPLSAALSVPVWHLHESIERLERLVHNFPRVSLGSSGKFAKVGTKEWWHRMTEAMSVACDEHGRPKAKLHGLRMLDPGVFSKLPLASADSCNVARNVGIDQAWRASIAPRSRHLRALIIMERIERHASAAYWSPSVIDAYQNMELFG